MKKELKNVSFLKARDDKSDCVKPIEIRARRKPVIGGRPAFVATRLTVRQLQKLDGLVRAYTAQSSVTFSRAAALATLIDRA